MEDSTQRVQEAIAAARAGQLSEARAIAEEITDSDPGNAHAWFLRGILSEDEAQQVEYIGKTLEIDPEHQAARRRMDQMRPPVEVEEEEAVAEVVEDEAMEEEAIAEAVEDEAMEEEAIAETVIAETPYVEEMSADDVTMEALFADEAEPEADEFEDEDMATVIAAAAVLGEDEAVSLEGAPEAEAQDLEAQDLEAALAEAEEPEVDAADLAVAAAGAAVADQAGEAWFEEEADDELWSKVEAEAVPDWLLEDTSGEADEALVEELPPAEADTAPAQDLPDWLLDEPEDEWPEPEVEEIVDEEPLIVEEEDEVVDEAVAAAAVAVAADEEEEVVEEEAQVAPAEEVPAPARPKKKKSSTRNLEILLILLIVVAIVVLGALVFFIVNPPSF